MAAPRADDAGERHDDLVARLADRRLVVLELEPGEIERLGREERDGDRPGEVGGVDEAPRAELRGSDRRDVVLLVVGAALGRLGRALANHGRRVAGRLARLFRRTGLGGVLLVRCAFSGALSLCVFFDGHW